MTDNTQPKSKPDPRHRSLAQLFMEEELRRHGVTVPGEGLLAQPKPPVTPRSFRVTETIPESDLRDMKPNERAKVEAHVRDNLVRRLAEDLANAGVFAFGKEKDIRRPATTYTLTANGIETTLQGAKVAQVWMDEAGASSISNTHDFTPPPPVIKTVPDPLAEATGRAQAMVDVAKALDEVEASLVPGADPAFIFLLLRDKLGLDT